MRILFLAPQPFYQLRGMCVAQKRCLEILGGMGAKVDVLAYAHGKNTNIPGIRILRLPPIPFVRNIPIGPSWQKIVLAPVMLLWAAWLCRVNAYDVVHACEESAFSAVFLKRVFRCKLVYDMDDILSQRLVQSGFATGKSLLRFIRAAEQWMIRSADIVLTNSPDTTEYAERISPSGAIVRYDHVPPLPPAEPMSEPQRRLFRASRGLNRGKIILYAGNLEPYQGIGLLLRSLPEVFRRSDDVQCVVIGGNPGQIEAYRRDAVDLGIAARVRWLGQKPLPETFGYMLAADVVVSPMTEEKAVPMKLYAYLASGTKIVATDLASHARLLEGRSALLSPPHPEPFAQALAQALKESGAARLDSDASTTQAPEWVSDVQGLHSAYLRIAPGRFKETAPAARQPARVSSIPRSYVAA